MGNEWNPIGSKLNIMEQWNELKGREKNKRADT